MPRGDAEYRHPKTKTLHAPNQTPGERYGAPENSGAVKVPAGGSAPGKTQMCAADETMAEKWKSDETVFFSRPR